MTHALHRQPLSTGISASGKNARSPLWKQASRSRLATRSERTTSRSAARLDRVNAVHRHGVGGRAVPIGQSSSTIAIAIA